MTITRPIAFIIRFWCVRLTLIRRRSGRHLLGAFLCASLAPLALAETQGATSKTILIFGDSISAAYGINPEPGWARLLQTRLAQKAYDYHVVNASISGETTSGGLARLPAALRRYAPAIVVVELGGNDALRGYPLERISDNLSQMLALCRTAQTQALVLPMRIPPNYGFDYSEGFFALFGRVADSYGVPVSPFFLDGIAGVVGMMQDDGIHPTARSQVQLLDNVWPVLQPLLSP